jgi:hypothetical protein
MNAPPKNGLEYNDFTINANHGEIETWVSTEEKGFEWGVGAGGELVILLTTFSKTFAARLTGPHKVKAYAAGHWAEVVVAPPREVVEPPAPSNVSKLILPTPELVQ